MKPDRDDEDVRPLPRDWLPPRQPPEGADVWAARVDRIMSAAGRELRRSSSQGPVTSTSWSTMAGWWKPAAALAAAALALFFVLRVPTSRVEIPPRSIPLNLVASAGDPVAVWEVVGVEAHPVLALIALQGRDAELGASSKEERTR